MVRSLLSASLYQLNVKQISLTNKFHLIKQGNCTSKNNSNPKQIPFHKFMYPTTPQRIKTTHTFLEQTSRIAVTFFNPLRITPRNPSRSRTKDSQFLRQQRAHPSNRKGERRNIRRSKRVATNPLSNVPANHTNITDSGDIKKGNAVAR